MKFKIKILLITLINCSIKFSRLVTSILIYIIYLAPSIILNLFNVKFINLYYQAIGHLISDTDTHIKKKQLNLIPNDRSVLLINSKKVANKYLLKYLRKYFTVIENPLLLFILKPFLNSRIIGVDIEHYSSAINKTAAISEVNSLWSMAKLDPLFFPFESDISRGDQALNKLGVPNNNWFVCLHVRSSGFSICEDLHLYRNSDFDSYIPAIKYIISLGGYCIRMGDSSMPIAPKIDGLIDYAHSDLKDDWLDLYISSQCKFFIGTGSGASSMPFMFGVPILSVNVAPLSNVPQFGSRDITIPKLYKYLSDNDFIGFKSIFSSEMSNFRYNDLFEKNEILVINNTSDEIKDAVIEMYLRLLNQWVTKKEDDELQERFISLLQEGHYSYKTSAKIGISFLRKYKDLIDS